MTTCLRILQKIRWQRRSNVSFTRPSCPRYRTVVAPLNDVPASSFASWEERKGGTDDCSQIDRGRTRRDAGAASLDGCGRQPANQWIRCLARPTHQASRRHLRREYLVRSLFRYLSRRRESFGRTGISRAPGYADGQRPERRAPHPQPESRRRKRHGCHQPVPAQAIASLDRLAEPRLHAGAGCLRPWPDGSVSAEGRHG